MSDHRAHHLQLDADLFKKAEQRAIDAAIGAVVGVIASGLLAVELV